MTLFHQLNTCTLNSNFYSKKLTQCFIRNECDESKMINNIAKGIILKILSIILYYCWVQVVTFCGYGKKLGVPPSALLT